MKKAAAGARLYMSDCVKTRCSDGRYNRRGRITSATGNLAAAEPVCVQDLWSVHTQQCPHSKRKEDTI